MPFLDDGEALWRAPEVPAELLDAPRRSDQDEPWWVHQDVPDVEVPEIPAWLLEAPLSNEPPCACSCCLPEEPLVAFNFHHAPDTLVDVFKAEWSRVQRHTARMWQALAAMYAAAGSAQAEFVADDVALITNTHPRTGLHLLLTGVNASAAPGLAAMVERGEIGSKHAEALLDEAGRWTDTHVQRDEVIALTIERCRRNVARGGSWPTPGELKKRLRTQALLLDLTAAEQAKKRVSQRRTVELMQTAIGQAQVVVSGPEVSVVQIMDAIRARAETLGRQPGDDRSLQQRMFDAAHELLLVDGAGGESLVPTIDDQLQPVTLTVRGVELAVVMPYSVGLGGDQELAEIVGLGPILPSAARELAAQAVGVRRVAVDADTGQVLAVDDKVPGPAHTSREPKPVVAAMDSEGVVPPRDDACPGAPLAALLTKVATAPVVPRDLNSSRYRVPGRLRRFVEHRDRTCTFPGCTLPGRWCDVDHREPWPYGETSPGNCHCLCRRHHRAKQAYFTVTLDQRTGDTVWTTPDGRTYRRPPPAF